MARRQASGQRMTRVGEFWGTLIFRGVEVIGNGVKVKVRVNAGPPVAQLRASWVFSVCIGSGVKSVIASSGN